MPYPPDLAMPAVIETPLLHLEPLQPRHVVLDYDAVMESREQLRLWSGSPWPQDDFTTADNLQDLRYHWREHQEHSAFTYTVLDPGCEICLGCVYMRPLAELARSNREKLRDISSDATLARFWIRTSRRKDNLEVHLLDTLVRRDWPFSCLLYETRVVNAAQIQLFENYPMRHMMTLNMPDRGGLHHFFEP